MKKKFILFVLISFSLTIQSFSGFSLGKINLVKNKVRELDEVIKWEVAEGEWSIINEELVIVGIGNNNHLMWPRFRRCSATNNNASIQWKNSNTSGQPIWDKLAKSYIFPEGESASNYPAFKWVEELVYKGFDDWRLPTPIELEQLYYYGDHLIASTNEWHYSNKEYSENTEAVKFHFEHGGLGSAEKSSQLLVRAVRDGSN